MCEQKGAREGARRERGEDPGRTFSWYMAAPAKMVNMLRTVPSTFIVNDDVACRQTTHVWMVEGGRMGVKRVGAVGRHTQGAGPGTCT